MTTMTEVYVEMRVDLGKVLWVGAWRLYADAGIGKSYGAEGLIDSIDSGWCVMDSV